eukprot:Blabericola_migrator_1__10793@NODE_61_length_15760_cov_113_549035_g55_i0_p10_GENE_NODE_61_length_15760_cov_113_549035_g55_i0NODE_61_length_15760_cov_113_549035_g55_i0_p10_ORF_typecomplete_len130_score7_59EXS/PF03124_14/0_016_NODE_61_length_15760_cov_113_549035_g55_i018902279
MTKAVCGGYVAASLGFSSRPFLLSRLFQLVQIGFSEATKLRPVPQFHLPFRKLFSQFFFGNSLASSDKLLLFLVFCLTLLQAQILLSSQFLDNVRIGLLSTPQSLRHTCRSEYAPVVPCLPHPRRQSHP